MKRLQLYVWEDVLTDYTPGIAFALASSLEEARELIISNERNESLRFDVAKAISDNPTAIHQHAPAAYVLWGGG